MKEVYTPKRGPTVINANNRTTKYNCDAYEYFRQKRKNDLSSIIDEINRREEEKYHLPTI